MATYHIKDSSCPIKSLTVRRSQPYLECTFRREAFDNSNVRPEEAESEIASKWLKGAMYKSGFCHTTQGNEAGEFVAHIRHAGTFRWSLAQSIPMFVQAMSAVLPQGEMEDIRYALSDIRLEKMQFQLNGTGDPNIQTVGVNRGKDSTDFTMLMKSAPSKEWLNECSRALSGLASVTQRGREIKISTLREVPPYKAAERLKEAELISAYLYDELNKYDLRIPDHNRDGGLGEKPAAMAAGAGSKGPTGIGR